MFVTSIVLKRNKATWATVGVALLIMLCMELEEVIQDCESNHNHVVHKRTNTANHLVYTLLLTASGYKGDKVRVVLRTYVIPQTITVPNSKERQEAIASAKYQGNCFQATFAGHLHTDNVFIVLQLKEHIEERLLVEKGKAQRLAGEKIKKENFSIQT